MLKIGFSIAVLATTAVVGFGSCSDAVGRPAVATGNKMVSIHPQLRREPHASATQVYLLRGLLNVFSLGMDSLADELHRAGHLRHGRQSHLVAKHRGRNCRELQGGPTRTHRTCGPFPWRGRRDGDGTISRPEGRTGCLDRSVRWKGAARGECERGPRPELLQGCRCQNYARSGFHGELNNYYAADPSVTHFNIDKSARFHAIVVSKVRGLQSTASRRQEHPEHLDSHS